MNLIREEIEGFKKRYGMSSEEFVNKFERGEIGDDQDYFEWWGLVRGLKEIEKKIGKIKMVLSLPKALTADHEKYHPGRASNRHSLGCG